MKRLLNTKLFSIVAVALALTCTATANAQFGVDQSQTVSLTGGAWVSPITLQDGSKGYLAMMFFADGSVNVGKFDGKANLLGKKTGRYSVEGNVLKVYLGSSPIQGRLAVVSVDKITIDGATWVRIHKN